MGQVRAAGTGGDPGRVLGTEEVLGVGDGDHSRRVDRPVDTVYHAGRMRSNLSQSEREKAVGISGHVT